jgi:hypothetical protein
MNELWKLLEDGRSYLSGKFSCYISEIKYTIDESSYLFDVRSFRLYADEILESRATIMDVEPVLLEDEHRSG